MKLLIPDVFPSPGHLVVPDGVEVIEYESGSAPISAAHRDAEALVSWGNSSDQLGAFASNLPRLRWVQALAAGPDAVLRAGFRDEVVITGGRGLHDIYVAEHALALILATVRRIPTMVRAQDQRRWPKELGGRAQQRQTDKRFSLYGAKVTIWGFGQIAQQLAPYLSALGAEVLGIAQSAGTRSGTPVVPVCEVERQLPTTDVLVMILPSNESTRHALNTDRLDLLPPHAFVVNVGRGGTLDEGALAAKLAAGTLAGAALDVFEKEPLPLTSPLWGLSNVILSPHASGGRPLGAAELVSSNLLALLEGRRMKNVVSHPVSSVSKIGE